MKIIGVRENAIMIMIMMTGIQFFFFFSSFGFLFFYVVEKVVLSTALKLMEIKYRYGKDLGFNKLHLKWS